jgi:hypothetical protein
VQYTVRQYLPRSASVADAYSAYRSAYQNETPWHAWKAFRAAPLRTGIFCFSLCGNATTFALRLDGTLLSLLSIQSGSAMICRYFSPNPQEPTRKTTSVVTGGVEHDQGVHRQSLEKLLRLSFQTPLHLHFQLLALQIDVLRPATIDAQLLSRLSRPLCTRLLSYRTRRQYFNPLPRPISELNPSMPPRLCQLPMRSH